LVYFRSETRRASRYNYQIKKDNEIIGTVTSGSFSPSLEVGIGMGYVNQELNLGEKISLCQNDISIPAKVVKRPFYQKGTVKIKERVKC